MKFTILNPDGSPRCAAVAVKTFGMFGYTFLVDDRDATERVMLDRVFGFCVTEKTTGARVGIPGGAWNVKDAIDGARKQLRLAGKARLEYAINKARRISAAYDAGLGTANENGASHNAAPEAK